MAKVITALVSTLIFGVFGLLIGWLNIRAQLYSNPPGYQISTDALLLSYGFAPLLGAGLGFALSSMCIKLFMSSHTGS